MKRKELTNTFMMISNRENPSGLLVYIKIFFIVTRPTILIISFRHRQQMIIETR